MIRTLEELQELDSGWYWMTNPQESDVFHPVKINKEHPGKRVFLDGQFHHISTFVNIPLIKATMPGSIN